MEWQTIDTAPKDGTRVLTSYKGVDVKVNYFNSHVGIARGYRLGREAWWFSDQDKQPTHWLQFPKPPSE